MGQHTAGLKARVTLERDESSSCRGTGKELVMGSVGCKNTVARTFWFGLGCSSARLGFCLSLLIWLGLVLGLREKDNLQLQWDWGRKDLPKERVGCKKNLSGRSFWCGHQNGGSGKARLMVRFISELELGLEERERQLQLKGS